MLGNGTLKRATMNVSEEGLKQFKVTSNEVGKLAQATKTGWHLTTHDLFTKVRVISFMEGVGCCAAGILAASVISGLYKSKKNKEQEKDSE